MTASTKTILDAVSESCLSAVSTNGTDLRF